MIHGLRVLLHLAAGREEQPPAAILHGRILGNPWYRATHGEREPCWLRWRQAKKGSKVHLAVDTLGYFWGLHVTAANGQGFQREPAQVAELTDAPSASSD